MLRTPVITAFAVLSRRPRQDRQRRRRGPRSSASSAAPVYASVRTLNPPAICLPVLAEPKANSFWVDLRASGDLPSIQTLDAGLDAMLARERMIASLAAFLGGLEIGVRMDLGARPIDIEALILRDLGRIAAGAPLAV